VGKSTTRKNSRVLSKRLETLGKEADRLAAEGNDRSARIAGRRHRLSRAHTAHYGAKKGAERDETNVSHRRRDTYFVFWGLRKTMVTTVFVRDKRIPWKFPRKKLAHRATGVLLIAQRSHVDAHNRPSSTMATSSTASAKVASMIQGTRSKEARSL